MFGKFAVCGGLGWRRRLLGSVQLSLIRELYSGKRIKSPALRMVLVSERRGQERWVGGHRKWIWV